MDLITKIAIIALILDVLLITGLLAWVSRFVYLDMIAENFNNELKVKLDKKDFNNLKDEFE
ncbi:MAG: hypothetical protein AB1782_06375, partial [Cyanobacteriota bacterium]